MTDEGRFSAKLELVVLILCLGKSLVPFGKSQMISLPPALLHYFPFANPTLYLPLEVNCRHLLLMD